MNATPESFEPRLDPLTGLSDRRTFLTILRRDAIRTMTSGGLLAVLVVNVDQFRRINSVFGFNVGDKTLIRVGRMLKELARRNDLVARIGSDEFALLLPGVMNEGHAVLAASKIERQLQAPLEIEGERVPVSVTIGIALCPTHSSHAESLLKHAELALLKARRGGLGYVVAEPVKTFEIADTWDLEIELESAVENEELELHYQPQISVADGKVAGAEALMRWNSPSRGLLRPGAFIPVAERTGRIHGLTQWALNTALRQARECRERTGHDFTVAVNIPATAFQNPQLIELVMGAMKLWDVPAERLVLEVTESLAMADPESVFGIMKRLRKAGALISIDDFGTGYSSLSYFRDIPADELKIDKVFVKRMTESEADASLISVMVELAHRFDITVVAEGVETEDALKQLADMGCDRAQGRLMGRPMPFESFCEWVEAGAGDWRAAGNVPIPPETDQDGEP